MVLETPLESRQFQLLNDPKRVPTVRRHPALQPPSDLHRKTNRQNQLQLLAKNAKVCRCTGVVPEDPRLERGIEASRTSAMTRAAAGSLWTAAHHAFSLGLHTRRKDRYSVIARVLRWVTCLCLLSEGGEYVNMSAGIPLGAVKKGSKLGQTLVPSLLHTSCPRAPSNQNIWAELSRRTPSWGTVRHLRLLSHLPRGTDR